MLVLILEYVKLINHWKRVEFKCLSLNRLHLTHTLKRILLDDQFTLSVTLPKPYKPSAIQPRQTFKPF